MPARKKRPTTQKRKRENLIESDLITQDSFSNEEVKKESSKRKYILILAVILLIAAAVYYFRSLFVVSIVNGEPITRFALIAELEKQGGEQVLKSLITNKLIEQEARKKNVVVSKKDIDEYVKKVEADLKKQGSTLETFLTYRGMTKEQWEKQIPLQIMVDKLVDKNVEVTDKEIQDYIEKNKASLPQDSTNMDTLKKDVKEQLRQQKVSEKYQKWFEDLQKNAKTINLIKF